MSVNAFEDNFFLSWTNFLYTSRKLGKPAVADVDECHDDEDSEGDGEEEEQHGGDHLGQRAHLLSIKGSTNGGQTDRR